MERAVGAAVSRVVEQPTARRRLRVGHDVVVLEIVRRRPVRQIPGHGGVLAEQATGIGDDVPGVPVVDLALHVVGHGLLVELLIRGVEIARGVDDHLRRGQQAQVVADVAEIGLDLSRLGFARRRELVVDRRFQCVAGAHVAQHAGHQHGDRAQQDQGGEDLGRQPPAHRTIGSGGSGVRHASTIYGRGGSGTLCHGKPWPNPGRIEP
jgi:hypothetical protein